MKWHLTLFIFLIFSALHAQSNRYWSDQFGSMASVLSGAVVGGDAGPGSIFYNPAQIANITDSKLAINSDVIAFEFFNGKNAFGRDIDLEVFNFRVFPAFVSFQFKSKKQKKLNFEYAVLTREETRFDFNNGRKSERTFPGVGDTRYNAQVDYFLDYKHVWMGFGAGYQINDQLSIGASMFLTAKSGPYKFQSDARAFPSSDSTLLANGFDRYLVSKSTISERYSFVNLGFLWKVGLQYQSRHLDLGLNITTPSVLFFSNGDISKEVSYINIPDGEGGLIPDFILADQQRKVKNQVKDPFSVSLGAVYKFNDNRTKLYGTVEYFSQINPYRVFDTEANTDIGPEQVLDSIDTRDFLNFYNGARSVVNVAVGFASQLSPSFNLITGFRTDFNARKDFRTDVLGTGFDPAPLSYNVFHFSFGGIFTTRKNNILTGLQFSAGGGDNLRGLADIDDNVGPGELPIIGQIEENLSLNYFAFAIFFGLDLGL